MKGWKSGRREGRRANTPCLLLPVIPSKSTSMSPRGLPRHPHLQPPSLSEWNPGRQRSHFQPVTVALQLQVPASSHWRSREPGGGRAQGRRAQGSRGRAGQRLGAGAAAPAHLPGGSRRAGRASRGSSDRSSPGSAGSAARPCGRGSGDSARRGPSCGRAPGQMCTAQSDRCSCKLWAGGGGLCQRPWHVAGGESVPISLLVLNKQAARGRPRMGFRPSLIKDMEPNQLILRAEGAPLINPPQHRTLHGKPGWVTWSWITHWPPSPAAVWLTAGSLSHGNCANLVVPSDDEVTQTHGKYKSPFIRPLIHLTKPVH